MSAVKHYHHHYHFSYTTSIKRHFSSTIVVLLVLSILVVLGFSLITPKPENFAQIGFEDLLLAAALSFTRLFIAYIFCLLVSIPLALLITASPKLERILLPVFDIAQSVPILAFFPLLVLVFIKLNAVQVAAIFVLFMSMLWGLTFNMVGGLKNIPEDVASAAFIFKAKGWKKLTNITLPAIFPNMVTGSLLSWGAGWNILIVAEVLHTYLPGGTTSDDLFGLGSVLVSSTISGQTLIFILSLVVMVIMIGLLNFFVWQRLLNFAQRFRFD